MASLLRSSLTYAPSIIVPRAFSYILVIVFTRLLAPSEFGLYSLVVTYGEVLDSVFMNWSRLGMLRFLRSEPDREQGGLIRTNLIFYGGSCLLGLAGATLFALTVEDATSSRLFFFALAVYLVGNSAMRFGLTILRAWEKQQLYALLEIIRPTLSFAGIFALIPLLGLSYETLAFGFFGVTALFGIGTLIWVTHLSPRSATNWQTMEAMLRYALPLVLMFLLSSIIRATDRYMLNALSGTAMVGLYAASFALSRPVIELFFNAINLGAFPRLVNLYEQDGPRAASGHLEHILTVQLFFGLPMVAGIAGLAEPLAEVLLGRDYRQGAVILMPVMALTGLIAGLKSFAFDQVFHLKKCPMTLNYTLLPAALINILLNYLFIRAFGPYGVAWATFIAYLLAMLQSMLLALKLLPFSLPARETGVALISSFTMWGALTLFMANFSLPSLAQVIVGVPLGALVFFASSLLLRSKTSKAAIKRLTSRINWSS